MSKKKRTAVHQDYGDVEVLEGPHSDLYWVVRYTPNGQKKNILCSEATLTFPPKAEDFENVYPIGGFISARHRTKGGADISASSGRIATLHRWQDQDGQWHAELLNDE